MKMDGVEALKQYKRLGKQLDNLKRSDIAEKFDTKPSYIALFRRLDDHDFKLIRGLIASKDVTKKIIAKKFSIPYSHMSLFRQLEDSDIVLIRELIDERDKMIKEREELRRRFRLSNYEQASKQ